MESGYIETDGTRIYYEAAGRGPAILFIHAGVADSRMWRGQMEIDGHRSIVFDQRGFGKTTWVPGPYSNRADSLAVLDPGLFFPGHRPVDFNQTGFHIDDDVVGMIYVDHEVSRHFRARSSASVAPVAG